MKNINDLWEDSDNYEPQVWVNKSETADFAKYNDLIGKLESLEQDYKQEDFDWLKSNNRTYEFGYENNQFHYFVYCIDWSELYGLTGNRLTIYDILISSNSESKRESSFQEAYNQIMKLFNGKITSSSDLIRCKEILLRKIFDGLPFVQTSKVYKSKGLNEFFKMLFDKIGNVDYEIADFTKPYLTGELQRSRFLIDVYDKILPAFEVSKKFNKDLKDSIAGVTIDNFFVLHVLLRHTSSFKFKDIYSPNSENELEIKNGLNKKQRITAHTNSEDYISVISKDGEFFPPNFSYNQNDYTEFKINGGVLKLDDIANNLFEKLKLLIPVFIENINSDFSPNIIYFENSLYGFEFPTWKYKQESTIELSSFYPLNSEHQLKKGISQVNFDRITNKDSIPNNYKIEIEK